MPRFKNFAKIFGKVSIWNNNRKNLFIFHGTVISDSSPVYMQSLFTFDEITRSLSLYLFFFFSFIPPGVFLHVTRLLTYAWKVTSLAKPYNIRWQNGLERAVLCVRAATSWIGYWRDSKGRLFIFFPLFYMDTNVSHKYARALRKDEMYILATYVYTTNIVSRQYEKKFCVTYKI